MTEVEPPNALHAILSRSEELYTSEAIPLRDSKSPEDLDEFMGQVDAFKYDIQDAMDKLSDRIDEIEKTIQPGKDEIRDLKSYKRRLATAKSKMQSLIDSTKSRKIQIYQSRKNLNV